MSRRVIPQTNEPHAVAGWDRFLFDAYKIRHVLDVGANIGGYIVTWLDNGATLVHAIEPVPDVYARMRETYKYDSRVVTHCLGVSDIHGSIHNANVFNCWTLLPDGKQELDPALEYKGRPGFDVALITIDELLEHERFAPDFIKIDVDGYDAKALRGARHYIARRMPVLMLELSYLPSTLGDCCECMIRDLFGLGYVLTAENGGVRFETVKDVMRVFPWDTSWNVIAEPRGGPR